MPESNANSKSTTLEEQIKEAHEEAMKDIEKDPSVNMKPNPKEDLDEGELARSEAGD